MDFVIFFSYSTIDIKKGKSMAVVKADSEEEASTVFESTIDKDEYKEVKTWWVKELQSMYGKENIIIP